MEKIYDTKVFMEDNKLYCVASNKRSYTSYEQASHSINVMHNKGHKKHDKRYHNKNVPVRIYKCPDCQYWHTTHLVKYHD